MLKHVARESTESEMDIYDPDMIQPNAVDLRVKKVFSITPGEFVLEGERKCHLPKTEILPDGNTFSLGTGVYLVEFASPVSMGKREAGMVISRSTLMRNGVWMTSALYDSGYHGKMVAGLYVMPGITFTFRTYERLAQFIVCDAESVKLYEGSYQGGKQ